MNKKQKNFITSFSALLAQAVRAINRYTGPKAVTLATGEMAIDFDDSWLIIGRPSGGRRLGRLYARHKELCADIRASIRKILEDRRLNGINFVPYIQERDLESPCIDVHFDKYGIGWCLIATRIFLEEDDVKVELEEDESCRKYGIESYTRFDAHSLLNLLSMVDGVVCIADEEDGGRILSKDEDEFPEEHDNA